MTGKLVYHSSMELHGNQYEIRVFCREDGRHFAKTDFSEDDIIINDGPSLNEVLSKHRSILPLAVSSRHIMRRFSGWPFRGKGGRP